MIVVDPPYLEGVKCRDDDAVFVPASRNTKGHRTFGSAGGGVYHKVGIRMKHYAARRAAYPEKHREYGRRSYARHREERLAHMKERREGTPRGKA